MKNFIEKLTKAGWRKRCAADHARRAPQTILSTLMLTGGLVISVSAQTTNDRLMSMTGVWTGPPLDTNGVPQGFMLKGDVQVPVPAKGGAPLNLPTPIPWPDGVVPFQFDANVSANQRNAMLYAMDELMKGKDSNRLHVAFVPRGGQQNYVHIMNSSVNSSHVGSIGGDQTLNVFNWNYTYIMVHEQMHALGLWHEQSRPDRDTYVTIHTQNIQVGAAENFDIEVNWMSGSTSTTYDFSSVMHYSGTAFSKNNKPTITANAGYDGSGMGQRDHISMSDYSDLYNVPEYGGGGAGYVDYRISGAGAGTLSSPWSGAVNGASQNVARQNPNPRSRLWVQGGNYAETGRLVGPQRILAIPGTGTVRIGP